MYCLFWSIDRQAKRRNESRYLATERNEFRSTPGLQAETQNDNDEGGMNIFITSPPALIPRHYHTTTQCSACLFGNKERTGLPFKS